MRGRRAYLGVACALAAVGVLAAVALANRITDDEKPTHTITGEYYFPRHLQVGCEWLESWGPRPVVNLYDGDGTVIATARFDDAVLNARNSCTATFAISNVPELPVYQMNTSDDSGLSTNSLEQLEAQDWVWQFG